MSWKIYHKDGSVLTDVNGDQITVHSLEYSDKWMGECFVTINFKHNAPIKFAIGDYLLYKNGERFELNYDPGKQKQARLNTYGEGFVYDSVKFDSLQDELARAEFLDVVLHDNQLHYTSMPKFQFYVETIDDLLDRIQANLDEQIGDGKWKVFSRSMSRSMQRGITESEWKAVYGEETSAGDFDSQSVTVDSQTCWEALALANSKWDINFVVRNRNVYVGTAGKMISGIFKYGLGKGLYEIDQSADSDQSIITRLRAYGSDKNLPDHYYADLGSTPYLNVTGDYKQGSTDSGLSVMLEDSEYEGMWTNVKSDNDTIKHVLVSCKIDDYTFDAELELVRGQNPSCTTRLLVDGNKTASDAVKAKIDAGFKQIDFLSGAKVTKFNSDRINYVKNLPNNMAISRLMLPGFPTMSLNEFWNTLADDEKKYVNPSGREHIFSTDKYRPYIDSVNLEKIGLRSGSQFFDTDDKTNGVIDIYPTIEEMEIGGVRVDEIYEGSSVEDNGRFSDVQTVPNFEVSLNPAIDFDLNELRDDDFSINMKDGMCGGRTFKVASVSKSAGIWTLSLQRVKDDALGLYFPYNDFQIDVGDHFVLTGIELPESYIRAASLKLLKYAIALLDKNDYTRYVYQPKVDEIFMARQHDEAMADKTGTIKSYHDTLKAGDIMQFEDEDFGIDAQITIDQLTIKEEDGKIPTYEITLREDKEVGTIQKIQNTISSIQNGNGGGGATVEQVKGQVASEGSKHFLSKVSADTAKEVITFAKGLISYGLAQLKNGATFGNNGCHFDASGNLVLDTLSSLEFDEALEKGFGFTKNSLGKYTLSLHNLIVWGKAIFNELEIRKLSYVGGNVVLSAAASKIVHVEEIPDTDGSVSGWKCYILADDGTTQTTNGWVVNDQAKCQQFNIKEGVYKNVSNRYYWRKVIAVSTEAVTIYEKREVDHEDGSVTMERYELYDGKKFHWIVLSKTNCEASTNDAPAANDTIVLDGHQLHNDSDASLTERTNLMMLETTGSGVPRIVALTGVTDFMHNTSNEVFILSPSKVTFVSQYFEFRSASGNAIKLINNRGAWVEGEKYYYYDQVVYENAYWTCIISGDNAYTTEKPSADSKVWRKDLEIGESVKVESTEVKYAYSDGTETPPIQPSDSEFAYTNIQDALAKMDIGDYLWSRTTVTYTDGNSSVTYSVSRMGADGENGKKGADGLTTHFAYAEGIVFGDDGKATGMSGTFSTTLFNGAQYIGTYTDDKLEDSTDFKAYDWTKLKGERGDKGDQGDKGDDAVVYSVITSYATDYISSTLAYGIRVYFRKTTGDDFENVTLKSDNSNGYCQVYVDGSFNANITNYLNSGNNFIDYSAHSDAIKPDSKIRIDWYSKDAALLAMGTYSVAGGNVIAYCNSDSKPSKPTSTDTSSLGGGWSLTPKSGGTYTTFGNVSFGSFSDSGGNSTAWSDESEDGYTWKKSPSGLSNSYGWALMKVSFETNTDNVDIEIALKAYSEENWDYIQVYALDTEASITAGSDYLNGGVKKISGNGQSASYTYNVAKAGQHFFYVAYAKDSSGSSNGDYGLFRIVSTPTTVTISSTVWMSKADVKDGRVQLPWSEPVKVTGEDGEGGLSVMVDGAPVIFDTDEDGIVPSSVSKSAKVRLMLGSDNVTADVKSVSSQDGKSENCQCSAKLVSGSDPYINVTVYGSTISKQYIDDNDQSKGQVSATAGFACISFEYKGKAYYAQVNFQVNVSKLTGSFSLSNKQLSSKFSELTNKGNGESITSLTDYKSEILQTAREISLKVSEQAVGRRNMLPGSAFRKGDDGPQILIYGDYIGNTYTRDYYGDQGIIANEGIDGTNCLKVKCYYDGSSTQYPGMFFRYVSYTGCGNIKIEKNKKYTISTYVKCDTVGASIVFETPYKTTLTASYTEQVGSAVVISGSMRHTITDAEVGKWILLQITIDTSNAGDNEYMAVQIWMSHAKTNVLATAYFCRPMMEEGEEYNGWTMSEEDYDYVGGNLIDNSRTFASGGNSYVQTRYGSVIANGYNSESSVFKASMKALAGSVSSKYSLPSSASSGTRYVLDSDWSVWQYNGNSLSDDTHYNGWQKTDESLHQDVLVTNLNLELNKDYIISWYAKCEEKGLFGAYAAGTGKTVYSEYSDGGIDQSTYGENAFLLTTQWKRFWMHVRLIKGSCSAIVFRQYRGEYSSGSPAMTVYFTQPKIEEGATMTDWTEKRTDMVDKQALLATGIDIKNKKITATADNFIVQNNSGGNTMMVDSDGQLNTNLVRAKALTTLGSDGRYVNIEDGLISIFGTQGVANIRFGVDSDGRSILSYYDNDGTWKYDLGPNGYDASKMSGSTFEELQLVEQYDVVYTNEVFYFTWRTTINDKTYELYRVKQSYDSYIFGNRTRMDGLYPSNDPTKYKSAKKLYRYSAGKLNGNYVLDPSKGLSTLALVQAADGKVFTSNGTLAKDGSLVNLATGNYFKYGVKTSLGLNPFFKEDFDWPAARYTGYIQIVNGIVKNFDLNSYGTVTVNGGKLQ